MRSSAKKARHQPPPILLSDSAIISSNTTGDSALVFRTEQFEQAIKSNVESNILPSFLSSAYELHELIHRDERLAKEYFMQIEKNTSHAHSNALINDLITVAREYFEQYLSASIVLRCYIQLHAPSTESGNNQGVSIQLQILKEIREMETIIETNENLLLDYYKKHYEILKSLNKYPSIEDFHLYLVEYENKTFDDIRSMILELRTMFLKTYDVVMKNLTKIRMPRSQQGISMVD